MEWISIQDKFPEDQQACLIVNNPIYNFAFWDAEYHQWISNNGRFDPYHATHWMPLPEPPIN